MDTERPASSSERESVHRDGYAHRREGLESFRLKNIIELPVLDLDIVPRMSLSPLRYDILVFDPGQMVGWAGLDCRLVGHEYIDVGQGEWHECLNFHAKRVFVEATPYAAQRTFDPWPIRFDGIVRAKIHPQEPKSVYPTNLKVAKKWFSIPRGSGLGRHARDALTHLVGVLVRESTR